MYYLKILKSIISNIKWTPLKISIGVNLVLVILIIFLFSGKPEVIEPKIIIKDRIVEVPAKEGVLDTIYLPEPFIVDIPNPVNQELLDKYTTLKDSVAKVKMFKEAITENEYNETYEDENVKIDVYTKVRGKLLKQAPNYFIKPSKITIQDTTAIITPYTPKPHLYGGIEIGVNIPKNNYKPIIKGNLIFQNKKGNSINVGYDTNKNVWVGKTWKLF